MATNAKIMKWGNSLALRIPKASADRLKLKKGSAVRIEDGKMMFMVAPIRQKRLTIAERIAGITPENLNIDQDWHDMVPVGREVW